MTAGDVHPPLLRLAVGLTPTTEAEFVVLVQLADALLSNGPACVIVVPALDQRLVRDRVADLVGETPRVVVEAAHDYLRLGHDRVALVGDDPALRGRSIVAALEWLRSLDGGAAQQQRGPAPDRVIAWLGSGHFPPAPLPADAPNRRESLPVVPLENGQVLLRTAWGATLLALTSDRSLTPDLVLDGVYDPAFVRFLERSITPGAVAVDVGANIGIFSVRLAQLVGPSGSVLALEADPDIHRILQENLDMNYVSGWARALEVAAYSSSSQLTFHRTARFRGNGSLLQNDSSTTTTYASEAYSTVTVQGVPLDEILCVFDEVHLVKIDVEGAERHVLEGLARTIDEGRLRSLAIEFVQTTFGTEWEPLCALLHSYRDRYGASFATVAPDGSRVPRRLEDAIEIGAYPQLLIDFGQEGDG